MSAVGISQVARFLVSASCRLRHRLVWQSDERATYFEMSRQEGDCLSRRGQMIMLTEKPHVCANVFRVGGDGGGDGSDGGGSSGNCK